MSRFCPSAWRLCGTDQGETSSKSILLSFNAVAVKTTQIQELSLLLWVSYFFSQKSVQLGAPVMGFPASFDTHCKQSLVLLSHCDSFITMCFT